MKRILLTLGTLLLLAPGMRAADLTVFPASVELRDAFDGRQILVSRGEQDVTRAARYSIDNPAVARVDAAGHVTPMGDGQARIAITLGDLRASVPITVKGCKEGRPIDFRIEVVPLLSKHGCNSGGCHGKASGQNGFRLSLFGFDADFDHAAITREGRGRRILPSSPDNSLFLMKASGRAAHGGGRRLDPAGEDYRVIRRWLEAGALPSAPNTPQAVKLHVFPTDRVLKPGQEQQLAVLAEYSDGSKRDVTRQAEFFGNLDVVAMVDHTGRVTAGQHSGEAALMARYRGHVAVFRAIVPHGPALQEIPGWKSNNYIDELSASKWKKLGLTPSGLCDDATFLRRVTVDLCGRLPTVEEAREFLGDTRPDRRTKLIDRLLESPDYSAFFALRWGSILRNSNLAGSERAAYAFHNWMKDMIARNRPYDEFVRGVVAAAGEWQDSPAINWYWQMRDDQLHQVTADTAQVFLGVRLQCARCHQHPFERWGQGDYYGLAGFFTRLGRKSFGEPPPYFNASNVTTGERNPLTGKTPEPKFLDGKVAKFSAEEDPRHALVDWMARPDNPFFAKTLVNRLWGHFLGRGLYHEVDDLRDSNPPANPELLDALAKDFVKSKFDVKHMIRTIVSSRVYQLASEPTEANSKDRQNFARFYGRRLIAEVLHDAVHQATGTRANFGGVSSRARAVDLPHENFGSYFLDVFDRPRRVSGCECDRSSGATLAQVLLLANSDEIEGKIRAGDGRVAKLMREKKSERDAIEDLYLAALSRYPTETEMKRTTRHLEEASNRQQALEDILWALLNSKEFLFNH